MRRRSTMSVDQKHGEAIEEKGLVPGGFDQHILSLTSTRCTLWTSKARTRTSSSTKRSMVALCVSTRSAKSTIKETTAGFRGSVAHIPPLLLQPWSPRVVSLAGQPRRPRATRGPGTQLPSRRSAREHLDTSVCHPQRTA